MIQKWSKMSDNKTRAEESPEADPIPGLVLFFYLAIIYWFFALVLAGGCGGGWNIIVGPAPRNPAMERALPADSQSCDVDYHPWNEPCNNP